MKLRRTEHNEQVALFRWAEMMTTQYPELRYMFAIPNASYGGSRRDVIRGRYYKIEGRKAGVPDICLPVARCGYNALYIEMKVGKNKPTDRQKFWIEGLKKLGNKVEVCYSFEEAKKTIIKYLEFAKQNKI